MMRTTGTTRSIITAVPVNTTEATESWLAALMVQQSLPWLLAVTREGIVWGELRDDELHLSTGATAFPDSGPSALSWEELESCRCFGPDGELLIWVSPSGPAARLRLDTDGDDDEYLEEHYQLWGEGRELRDGFVRLVEGEQGITHHPPLGAAVPTGTRASLQVRHYLREDAATGVVSIGASRLVGWRPLPSTSSQPTNDLA